MRPFTSRPAKNKKAVDAPESVPRPGMSAVWNDYDIGIFERVVNGEFDHFPEQAFYMKGGIEDVIAAGKELGLSV